MKKYDLGISAIMILISVWIIHTSCGYGTAVNGTAMGAGEWPAILAGALILLSLILAGQALIGMYKERRQAVDSNQTAETFHFFSGRMMRVYLMIAVMIAYYFVLRYFGFWVASVIAVPVITFLMGEKTLWKIAVLTAGILLFVFLVFDLSLGLSLPTGLLFR